MIRTPKQIKVLTWLSYLKVKTGRSSYHSLEKLLYNDDKSFEIEDRTVKTKRIFEKYQAGNTCPSPRRVEFIGEKVPGSKELINSQLWLVLNNNHSDKVDWEYALQKGSKLLYRFYSEHRCDGYSYIRALDALVQHADLVSLEAVLSLTLLSKSKQYLSKSLMTDLCYSLVVLLSALPHRHPYLTTTISDIREIVIKECLNGIELPFDLEKVNFTLLDRMHSKLAAQSDELYNVIGRSFKQANYHFYFHIFLAIQFDRFDWFLLQSDEVKGVDSLYEAAIWEMKIAMPLIKKRIMYRQSGTVLDFEEKIFKKHRMSNYFGMIFFELYVELGLY